MKFWKHHIQSAVADLSWLTKVPSSVENGLLIDSRQGKAFFHNGFVVLMNGK